MSLLITFGFWVMVAAVRPLFESLATNPLQSLFDAQKDSGGGNHNRGPAPPRTYTRPSTTSVFGLSRLSFFFSVRLRFTPFCSVLFFLYSYLPRRPFVSVGCGPKSRTHEVQGDSVESQTARLHSFFQAASTLRPQRE